MGDNGLTVAVVMGPQDVKATQLPNSYTRGILWAVGFKMVLRFNDQN